MNLQIEHVHKDMHEKMKRSLCNRKIAFQQME
jgi:hypothetical protein